MLYLEKGEPITNNGLSVITNTYCDVDETNIMHYYEETIVDGSLYEVNEITDKDRIEHFKIILM